MQDLDTEKPYNKNDKGLRFLDMFERYACQGDQFNNQSMHFSESFLISVHILSIYSLSTWKNRVMKTRNEEMKPIVLVMQQLCWAIKAAIQYLESKFIMYIGSEVGTEVLQCSFH